MKITEKDLAAVCARINRTTGNPEQPYVDNKAQIGCYHLDFANGGVALHRMSNESGAAVDVFGCHMPKAELYYRMQAFLKGWEAAKEAAQ